MNVFASSACPVKSAQALADTHVVKMAVEAGQILSTVLALQHGLPSGGTLNGIKLYEATHCNHPCVKWAGRSPDNFRWLAKHGLALCREYSYRFSTDRLVKIHGSFEKLAVLSTFYVGDDDPKPSSFALAMDDDFRQPDPHAAYRAYLRAKYFGWIEGHGRIKWTRRELPEWLRDEKFISALDSLRKSR